MKTLTTKDKNNIRKFHGLFPREIGVLVQRSEDGGFFAEILAFDGKLCTEAQIFSELIEMVNDAVTTYLEIPKKYISFMPSYIPPLKVAQEFGIFPAVKKAKEITLPLALPIS